VDDAGDRVTNVVSRMAGDGARRSPGLLPWAAFVLALAVRLPLMNAGLFHHDEVQLARAVEASWKEHRILPAVKGRQGAVLLNLVVYAPAHALAGAGAERTVPLVGVASGALLVAAVLLLAWELTGDPLAGALGGVLTFGSAIFLTSSSTGKENAPQMAFVALALWLAARAARRNSWWGRAAASAVFGLALSIHEGGIVLAPLFALSAAALEWRYGGGWRATAFDLGALALAAAVPVRLSIWDEVLRNARISGPNSANFLGPWSPLLPGALRDTAVGIGIPAVLLAAAGSALSLVRWREMALGVLLPWIVVILYFGNVTSYTPRYLLYLLPTIATLGGAGGAWLLRRWFARNLPVAAAALAIVACAPGVTRAYPLLAARSTHSGPKEMAGMVRELTSPGDVVLCQDDSPFLEYYAPGRTLLKQPIGDPMAVAAFAHELKERARGGVRIYAGQYAFSYDDAGHFASLLESYFLFVPVGATGNESFYRPELQDVRFRDVLYRLDPR
jgi:hypothetical protein